MRSLGICSTFLAILITGCSLAGDITPPVASQPEVISSREPGPAVEAILAPPPNVQPDLTRGAEIFSEKCASCHGDLGRGGGSLASNLLPDFPPAPIGDPDYARAAKPEDWFQVVSIGVADRLMPGFASLSARERWDVVGYAFWLALSNEVSDSMDEVFTANCLDCHRDEDLSTSPFASLSGASVDDLYQSISNGVAPGMPAFEALIPEDQRHILAAYFMLRSLVGNDDTTALADTDIEPTLRTIRGQVVNRTTGGSIAQGLQSTLHVFADGLEVQTEQSTLDANGEFNFEDVEIMADQTIIVTVEFQGVLYGTQFIQSAPQEDQSLTLDIYQSTTDMTKIVVDRLHVIFSQPEQGILEVTELWIVSNRGDETVANVSGEGVLQVNLPEGVSNLKFENGGIGDRFQLGDSGFVDRIPLRPGEPNHEIVFSFEMAYDEELEFSQLVQYPVQAIVILSPESGPELSGKKLQDLGFQELNGATLHNYSTPPLTPGDRLTITVSASTSAPAERTDLLLGGIALAAALFGAGFWWSRMDRKLVAAEPQDVQSILKSQDPLIQRIADLDDAFDSGEIKENDYLKQRTLLKEKLHRVLREELDD
ncbi:MAG: c-type cytochrome [Chloroflexi bacterium]|nr:c-type cytochrome [Chloroflexota bacterium]